MTPPLPKQKRFYLRFKENYRQLGFDALQGVNVFEEDLNASSNAGGGSLKNSPSTAQLLMSNNNNKQDEQQAAEDLVQSEREREENIRQLVSDCRKQLVDTNEDCYGSWALINYNELIHYKFH